jgi:hypothetical protein
MGRYTMSGRGELRETWRAAMSSASGTQRNGDGERPSPRADLFRETDRAFDDEPSPSLPLNGGHVLFFPGEDGYAVRDVAGPCPEVGEVLDQDGRGYRVLKVGISPFPQDPRPCAYLETRDAPARLVELGAGRRVADRG